MISEDKKQQYWNYFTSKECRAYWHIGMTSRHFQKVKPLIWDEDMFWFDVITCHNGHLRTPQELRSNDKFVFEHCIGNFFGHLSEVIYREEIK